MIIFGYKLIPDNFESLSFVLDLFGIKMRSLLASVLLLSVISFSAINARTTSFDEYWTLDQINDYLFDLQERFPEIIEVEDMDITTENRTVHGVRIVNVQNLEERNYTMPIVLITAGASGRDWISSMAAINVGLH